MVEHLPPPTYSQQDPVGSHTYQDPQILIVPTVDVVNFQKGYLGAEGEQAAVEGELQIKGVDAARWDRVTISLRSFENAYHHEIDLANYERELYARTDPHDIFPSSIPFAIPLPSDTPQSIQTPHSTLGHQLTATLYPADSHLSPLSKSLTVHTRRYTSHSHTLPSSPETYALDDPTRVEVQVPRNTFTSGEVIPLYVTVPPPARETVVRWGLRLRNVRAELVRVVKVKREHSEDVETDSDSDIAPDESSNIRGGSFLGAAQQPPTSSKMPLSPLFLGSSYRTIIARSGASCRFHSSRPIQLRFVLHQNSTGSPSDSRTNLGRVDSDAESPLLTQSTLLHSVTFHIKIHISFVDTSNQTERISTIVVPITILPPLAPLPEVSQAVDDAYQKKHDRPPAKTTRAEEVDPSIPHYSEGEAGPSMLSSGAPPPFEERDAPPPFFVSALETSLPTFQESETEIILPETDDLMNEIPLSCSIPGEGTLFGFLSSEQFDGHSEDIQQSSTPPPTLEMASGDTDLTALVDQPTHISMEALSLVLDQHDENPRVEEQPPPPPAMDDPSDPPPSIDSDFRSPVVVQQTSPSQTSPPLHVAYHQSDTAIGLHISTPVLAPEETRSSHGHAPPPYLTDSHRENESDQVTRPPPYVD
ncbi:hypothetical protein BYT27DRAFT_7165344 [Phlegmacium glaucopus]|nr:hypothetical protein BYT27DRAFT_7165344 [Phlegmacium glaucopus]